VHQAADTLFCKGNYVPVGKDALPHVEMTRMIARRFTSTPELPGIDARAVRH
jgi:tryptophanyl-tRNA synthetase